jgi:hypothetical protein
MCQHQDENSVYLTNKMFEHFPLDPAGVVFLSSGHSHPRRRSDKGDRPIPGMPQAESQQQVKSLRGGDAGGRGPGT